MLATCTSQQIPSYPLVVFATAGRQDGLRLGLNSKGLSRELLLYLLVHSIDKLVESKIMFMSLLFSLSKLSTIMKKYFSFLDCIRVLYPWMFARSFFSLQGRSTCAQDSLSITYYNENSEWFCSDAKQECSSEY
jgi:hypothetical protein